MEYTKPALTYEQQADLAMSKGLGADRDELVACLERIGYYRLSGYWHILKDPDTGLFHGNATLDRVLDLYTFDRRLKLLVFTLYRGAPNPVRKKIASSLGVAPRVLDSWLLAINTTRNICAHHGRLWNRVLVPRAKNDPRWHTPYEVETERPCMVLTVLSCLLETIAPECGWQVRLLELLAVRSTADMERMGFTDGWELCPLWARGVTGLEDAAVLAR